MLGDCKVLKKSKTLMKIKEGDQISVNGKEMIVDKQYLFMDHGKTKEMIIEFYNKESEREYQMRYFDDQGESSIEIYELQGDFQYTRREPKTLAW